MAEGEDRRAGSSVPFAGDAGFHAQVGLELLLRELQKQVAIYLLLLGEGSDVRKGFPPQPLDPKHKMQGQGTGDGDGTQIRAEWPQKWLSRGSHTRNHPWRRGRAGREGALLPCSGRP